MSDEYKRLRIKGHRLIRSYQRDIRGEGCVDGYCECGEWTFRGWTHLTSRVVESHNEHLEDVRDARKQARAA